MIRATALQKGKITKLGGTTFSTPRDVIFPQASYYSSDLDVPKLTLNVDGSLVDIEPNLPPEFNIYAFPDWDLGTHGTDWTVVDGTLDSATDNKGFSDFRYAIDNGSGGSDWIFKDVTIRLTKTVDDKVQDFFATRRALNLDLL